VGPRLERLLAALDATEDAIDSLERRERLESCHACETTCTERFTSAPDDSDPEKERDRGMMQNCKSACKSVKHHCREATCLDAGDAEPNPLQMCSECKENARIDDRDTEVACKELGKSIRGMPGVRYGLGCENAATCKVR